MPPCSPPCAPTATLARTATACALYTNSRQNYNSYGSTLGLTYNFFQKYTVGGNVNYNALSQNSEQDVFVTGFNTPKWAGSASFGNREIVRNLGFNVVYHWQTSFYWESPLANGQVPAFNTLDAQVNLRVPTLKTTLKLGATDIFKPAIRAVCGWADARGVVLRDADV